MYIIIIDEIDAICKPRGLSVYGVGWGGEKYIVVICGLAKLLVMYNVS